MYMMTNTGDVFETKTPEQYPQCVKINRQKYLGTLVKQRSERLKQSLKIGATVYTINRHTSGNGMCRRISLLTVVDGEIHCIDHIAALILRVKMHPSKAGITVHGAGMDAGFQLVYELGKALWPNGAQAPHSVDGGYALKHVRL